MAARLAEASYECVTLLDEDASAPAAAAPAKAATPAAAAATAATAAAAEPGLPEARRILKELMALVQWARGGRARQIWIHYCGIGMNQVYSY